MGISFRGLGIIISNNNCLNITNRAGKLHRRILDWETREEERLKDRREGLKYNKKYIYNNIQLYTLLDYIRL